MKIYKTSDILKKLENAIEYKKPFSHIRFGDGGIKFLHAILFDDKKQLDIIIKKEGIPKTRFVEIFELWGKYAREADFIDTPEVYFQDTFWDRTRAPGKPITSKTEMKLRMWKDLYDRAEFDNINYCNPESNYLMVTKIHNNKTLVDIMKNKKIAVITARPEIKNKLVSSDVDIIKIVGQYGRQYKNSFESVINIIERTARNYDFWLVAAGELGRVYSGFIKENGGRTIDIGFIAEFWLGQDIHPRLSSFLRRSFKVPLELELTFVGKKYEDYI
jgi:hypothetical protein